MSRMPDLFSPFHVVIASDHKYFFLETYLCFGKKQEKGWKLYMEFLILGLAVKFYQARSAENADIGRSAVAAPHFHLDPCLIHPPFFTAGGFPRRTASGFCPQKHLYIQLHVSSSTESKRIGLCRNLNGNEVAEQAFCYPQSP